MKNLIIVTMFLTALCAEQIYSLNQVMVDLYDKRKPVFFCFDKDTYNSNLSRSELKQFQAYIREYVKYNFSFHLENHDKPWQNIAYTQHGIEYVMVCEIRIRFSVHVVLTLYYQGNNDMQWEQIFSINCETKKPIWGEVAKSLATKTPKPSIHCSSCKCNGDGGNSSDSGNDSGNDDSSKVNIKKYDSGWFPVEFAKIYKKKHSLGYVPTIVQVWYSENSDGSGGVTITGVSNFGAHSTTVGHIDSKIISIKTGAGAGHIVHFHNKNGVYLFPRKGYIKITALYIGD